MEFIFNHFKLRISLYFADGLLARTIGRSYLKLEDGSYFLLE